MQQTQGYALSVRDAIRAGLRDTAGARKVCDELAEAGVDADRVRLLVSSLAHAADPDTALRNYVFIGRDLAMQGVALHDLVPGEEAMARLVAVLGSSDALGKLMRFRPRLVAAAATDPDGYAAMDRAARIAALESAAFQAVQDDTAPEDGEERRPWTPQQFAAAVGAMRAAYREQLAAIMARDTTADDPVAVQGDISLALSDLADAALETALSIAYRTVPGAEAVRFAVIAMGKLGARELNYVSDVDLIYVAEPADGDEGELVTRTGTKIATTMQRACQSAVMGVAEPVLWQIDGALRPEGKDGVLVRRLESHRAYYEQWAENWEFQAQLKARAAAGDEALGGEYIAMTRPLVWQSAKRPNFVHDCQAMRERVECLIAPALQDREIKLGKGGLRDIEFTVQMLQLVHGRTDPTLRVASTRDALKALSDGGYISRADAATLVADYGFERVLEHRQQMWELKRTHLFADLGAANTGGLSKPRDLTGVRLDDNEELGRLARTFRQYPEALVERYDTTRQRVRRLHNEIYYRPMLPISAADDAPGLSPQALEDRYESIGFSDAQAAIRHVQALTAGVARAAKINRILLPAVLRWLGEGQNPDMGLLYWRKLADHFGRMHEYLGFLRDSPSAAKRLCHVLSNSRSLGDALDKSLESVTWLGHDELLRPRGPQSLGTQTAAIIHRYEDSARECAQALRALKRHETERIGLGWMNGVASDTGLMRGLTDMFDAVIDAALRWSVRAQCAQDGLDVSAAPAGVCVIAMGRYGGREVNFCSDADVMLIYRATGGDEERAAAFARAVADRLRQLLQGPLTMEPKLDLDMDLRPEGKHGPVVRSLESCAQYYAHWAATWEYQALLRARYAAGDETLARDFLEHVADPLRYPASGLDGAQAMEIRRLKARMESERLPRGVARDRHVKLGHGGLSDVEWTVQLLQLRHAARIDTLRVCGTLEALDALESAGFVDGHDAGVLRDAWRMATRTRNGNFLWTGRANQADVLPRDWFALSGIGMYAGYGANHGQQFENDLLALMRRCRDVTERLFYRD